MTTCHDFTIETTPVELVITPPPAVQIDVQTSTTELTIEAPIIEVVAETSPVELEIAQIGVQGPPGPPGAEYVHHQVAPAATWVVEHNLGTRPDLVLFLDDDPDECVETDVTYPDDNTTVVEWPSPVTGTAYAR